MIEFVHRRGLVSANDDGNGLKRKEGRRRRWKEKGQAMHDCTAHGKIRAPPPSAFIITIVVAPRPSDGDAYQGPSRIHQGAKARPPLYY